MRAFEGKRRHCQPQVTFTDSEGRKWRYRGKRARVLILLHEGKQLTQLDTVPWHTRLGGTIHALREDGLVIETEIVGEFRHARYRLRTKGSLLIHPIKTEGGVKQAA